MAKPEGGLTKWFKEDWVDIGSKKKGGGYVSAREDIIRAPSQPNGNLTVANLVRAALRNTRVEGVAYYADIHAKRKRIKAGLGEKMRNRTLKRT